MDTCPKCGCEVTNEAGFFDGELKFWVDRKKPWYIRTRCYKCRKFLGYRPTDTRKLKWTKSHGEDS